MTLLVCVGCEKPYKAPFNPTRADIRCDCGQQRVLPSQAKQRKPLKAVSDRRQRENVAKGKPVNATASRRQPDRDWIAARAKVEAEGCCRVCGVDVLDLLVAAHITGRVSDRLTLDGEPVETRKWKVEPDRIVTLCRSRDRVKGCHEKYDDHELSILSVLHLHEQIQAVRDAGGLELARKRTAPTDYAASGVAEVRAA
jgi:hypothetical protein